MAARQRLLLLGMPAWGPVSTTSMAMKLVWMLGMGFSATVIITAAISTALFHRLAREHDTGCQVTPHFTADLFPAGHPAEPLLRVGPIARHTPARGVQSQLENPIPV